MNVISSTRNVKYSPFCVPGKKPARGLSILVNKMFGVLSFLFFFFNFPLRK